MCNTSSFIETATNKNIKSSLHSRYHAEACKEWRDPSPWVAPRQNSCEETSQRWQTVSGTVSNVTNPEIEPQTYRADSESSTTALTKRTVAAKKSRKKHKKQGKMNKAAYLFKIDASQSKLTVETTL